VVEGFLKMRVVQVDPFVPCTDDWGMAAKMANGTKRIP